MSPVLGPDGRPVLQDAGGETKCVLCARQEPVDVSKVDHAYANEGEWSYEDGLVHGYAIGINLLATVLIGCGLDRKQAAHVQEVSSSLCAEHMKLMKDFLDENLHEAPVERAVSNLRSASTFFVGRGPGGAVRGMGP